MNNQWFQSSTGNGDLALTLKGALVALIPFVVSTLAHYHIVIGETQITDFITAFTAVISAVVVVAGLARKLYYAFKNPSTPSNP